MLPTLTVLGKTNAPGGSARVKHCSRCKTTVPQLEWEYIPEKQSWKHIGQDRTIKGKQVRCNFVERVWNAIS